MENTHIHTDLQLKCILVRQFVSAKGPMKKETTFIVCTSIAKAIWYHKGATSSANIQFHCFFYWPQ